VTRSLSNLLKGMWVNVKKDEARVIDNNELAEMKIQKSVEDEYRRKQSFNDFGNAQFPEDGEFTEGLNAEQLSQLTDDFGLDDLQAPAEMNLSDLDLGDFAQNMPTSLPDDFGQMGQSQGMAQNTMSQGHVPMNVQKEVDTILSDAQEQARQIVEQARAEAESVKNDAIEEGRKQGYDEGYSQGYSEANEKVSLSLNEKTRELEDNYEKMIASVEPEMVDALTKIYEHVFNVSFKEDKNIVLHLLKNALSRIESNGNFLVHIAPDDFDIVSDAKEMLKQTITNPDTVLEIVEDSTLHENECIIETDGGVFDCSLGVELEELSRKLKLLSYDRR